MILIKTYSIYNKAWRDTKETTVKAIVFKKQKKDWMNERKCNL